MRILGLDFGAKTVGVAVSDPLGITAQGVTIIRRTKESHLRQTLQELEKLKDAYEIGLFVVGLPMHLDGNEGERCEKTRAFGSDLSRRTGIDVVYWDERLTTVQADRAMEEKGLNRQEKREHVDRIAAELILQSYLDAKGIPGEES